jgi:hypothetical protein
MKEKKNRLAKEQIEGIALVLRYMLEGDMFNAGRLVRECSDISWDDVQKAKEKYDERLDKFLRSCVE